VFCPFRHCIVCPVLRRLITTLVSFGHCIVSPVLRRLITTLVSFVHCIVLQWPKDAKVVIKRRRTAQTIQ
jgi:hypothetical protein